MKRIPALLASIAMAVALLAGPAAAQQSVTVMIERAGESRAKGSPDAPVLVYEIADFQCPYCARFAQEILPGIDSAYIRAGHVQWVFVNLPMPSHGLAWIASEAALCAGAVSNRFWAMHDSLYAEPAEWIEADDPAAILARFARGSNVDMDSFADCIDNDRVAPLILQDVIFGSRVTGTPTFIVDNRQTIVGLKSFEEWREILEAALQRK